MNLDFPFLSWIISRRMPVFVVITAVIIFIGNIFVSRVTPSYFASTQLQVTSDFFRSRSENTDPTTEFEFLKFRVITSPAMSKLTENWGPVDTLFQVHHHALKGIITLGLHHTTPEGAKGAIQELAALFIETADLLRQNDLQKQIEFDQAAVETFRKNLQDQIGILTSQNETGRSIAEVDYRNANTLLAEATERLVQSKALLQVPQSSVLRIVEVAALPSAPSGPKRNVMLIALTSFAIFCALITILILEWLDTVIRRPRDIEHSLCLETFGIIPDLRPQPIKNDLAK